MLIECGFTRITDGNGAEFTFTPSLSRIASLGSPFEIVRLYAGLHGPKAAQDAAYVLACLCDQDDATPLIGWIDEDGKPHAGTMPPQYQIIIALHLMKHGIIGKSKPGGSGGKFSEEFKASEYIAAACVHLGLSRSDAEQISMTEFHEMFEMKFPDLKAKQVPSKEAYRAFMEKMNKKAV